METPRAAGERRAIRWGRWALVGCAVWIALMLLLGTPIGIFLTPAFGPVTGWLLGGVLYLVAGVNLGR